MHRYQIFLFLLLVSLATVGCAQNAEDFDPVLANGTDFELFSLDPSMLDKAELDKIRADSPDSLFQNWKIIGSTKVSEASIQGSLVKALAKAEAENDRVAACFNPRHGIRVTHEGKQYDYAICFECFRIYRYLDNERDKTIKTTKTPKAAFDKVLTDADVALPRN